MKDSLHTLLTRTIKDRFPEYPHLSELLDRTNDYCDENMGPIDCLDAWCLDNGKNYCDEIKDGYYAFAVWEIMGRISRKDLEKVKRAEELLTLKSLRYLQRIKGES